MKKGILTNLILSISLFAISVANAGESNSTAVILPDLPLSTQAKAFTKKYPNTAKAMQIEIYTINLSYHAMNESEYHPTGEIIPANKLHKLKTCIQDFYTTDRLNILYQKMPKTLPKNELSQLEGFYRSDVGQRYLTSKLRLAHLFQEKGLKSYLTMTDTHTIIKDNEADMPALETFITSKAYNDYFEVMYIKAFSKAEQDTQQCIDKIIGRDLI